MNKPIVIGYPQQRRKSQIVDFPDGRVTIHVWNDGTTIVSVEAHGDRFQGEPARIIKVVNETGRDISTAPATTGVGIHIKGTNRSK